MQTHFWDRLLLLSMLPVLIGAADVPYADDPWTEVTTANFRLISNAEESATLDVAKRLEQFRAMAPILTGATRVDSTLPVLVFVFGDRDTWEHFEDRPKTVAGYFVNDTEANYIALDVSGGEGQSGMPIVFHEYVHFLSRNRASKIHQPTWYEEGLADAISTMEIDDGKIYVGVVPGGHVALLEKKKWLPLERVVTSKGYEGLSSREMSMFYAQSWLLVHRFTWGHVADLEPRFDAVIEYIRRVGTGEPEAAAFRESFGGSFKDMEKELRGYLRKGPPEVRLDEKPPEFEFDPRVQGLGRGTALVLLGELQLARGEEGAAQAEALARLAVEAEPESPRALLLLARALAEQGKDPGDLTARALAVSPDSAEVVRGAAHVGRARLQKAELSGPDRRAIAEETRDLYARAVALDPDSAAAHAGLGFTQLMLNQPMEANASLQQAFLMQRWNLNVVLALGELHAQYGRPEDGRRLLREVAGAAHHEELRARAREVLDEMPSAETTGN